MFSLVNPSRVYIILHVLGVHKIAVGSYAAPKKEQEATQSTLDKVKEWTEKDQQEHKELILDIQAGYQQALIERNKLLGESMYGAENYPFTEEATIKNYDSESPGFKLGKIWGMTGEYAEFLNPGSGTNAIKNGVGKGTLPSGINSARIKSLGNGVWESTEGLIYGQGSKQGNRVQHILEHASPDPTKPLHSVFNVPKNKILDVVDEAWSKRATVIPISQANGNQVFNIPMGKIVGTNGEMAIRIVVKNGTSEVITAFPVK